MRKPPLSSPARGLDDVDFDAHFVDWGYNSGFETKRMAETLGG